MTSIPETADATFNFMVYPNPFSQNLYIDFCLIFPSSVDIEVLDMSGRVIHKMLKDANKLPGTYRLSWDGNGVPDGIYFLRCLINDEVITKKVLLNN